LLFLKAFAYFNGKENAKKKKSTAVWEIRNYDISNILVKNPPSSAAAFRNAPGNLGTEILNRNSVINMLKERLALNFMSMKFKELIAQKCCERLLLNKPDCLCPLI
jgi:hypothetical protein